MAVNKEFLPSLQDLPPSKKDEEITNHNKENASQIHKIADKDMVITRRNEEIATKDKEIARKNEEMVRKCNLQANDLFL